MLGEAALLLEAVDPSQDAKVELGPGSGLMLTG